MNLVANRQPSRPEELATGDDASGPLKLLAPMIPKYVKKRVFDVRGKKPLKNRVASQAWWHSCCNDSPYSLDP